VGYCVINDSQAEVAFIVGAARERGCWDEISIDTTCELVGRLANQRRDRM